MMHEENEMLFEGYSGQEESIINVDEPTPLVAKKEESLATLPEASDDLNRKIALHATRETLKEKGITLDYIMDLYKNAAENAVTETFSWTIIDDHKTRISAANKMLDTWKVAHGLNKKDPVEIVFKPIFDKPPMLQ